jgi:glycosyltransferase involved in cell wall biosynthesis
MSHVGIDLEQFVADPYGSGIQRVLQQLARHWPTEIIGASFVVPDGNDFLLLAPEQAAALVTTAFERDESGDRRARVQASISELAKSAPRLRSAALLPMFSAWLLPEVSYLPSVLARAELFRRAMPITMIGYDTLPMIEPGNYRFTPGTVGLVSEYFRLLANADQVVCISDYARASILDRLRRDRSLPTRVAHPGGDHIPVRKRIQRRNERVRFLRLGTLEARKMPREILRAFRLARSRGLDAELTFLGAASASDHNINAELDEACRADSALTWISNASDEDVISQIQQADIFLSLGTEGYGIPVLESIRLGTPVAFAGIQPAAELMEQRGAMRIDITDDDSLAQAFVDLATRAAERSVHVEPDAVPTWRGFATVVAEACTS